MEDHPHAPRWKHDGVKVIPAGSLDSNTAQTPGMDRKAAINAARVGAQKIWAGTVTIHANAKTGAHHHGALESVIYIVRGRARMRWGSLTPWLKHRWSSIGRSSCAAPRSLSIERVHSSGRAVAAALPT